MLGFNVSNISIDFVFFFTGIVLIIFSVVLAFLYVVSDVDIFMSTRIPMMGNPVLLCVVGFGLIFCKYVYGDMIKNGV